MAAHKRLEPQLSFEEFAAKSNNPPEDRKTMSDDVNKACRVLEEEQAEDKVLPTFIPGAQAFEHSEFGHTISVKGGLLSETELISHTGKSGKDLGLTAYSVAFEHGQAQSYYVISLEGLDSDFKDAIRKIKFHQTTTIVSDKMWVTPSTQLAKWHGKSMAEHLSSKYSKGKPSINNLPSLESLKDLATRVEANRQKLLEGDVEAAALDQSPEEPVGPVVRQNALLEGFDDADAQPKKRQKRKTAAAATGQATRTAAVEASPSDGAGGSTMSMMAILGAGPDHAPPALAPNSTNEDAATTVSDNKSMSKKSTAFQQELASMDVEMRKVATLHCGEGRSAGKNTSAKSLAGLVVGNFLRESTDHNKGHALHNVSGLNVEDMGRSGSS